MTEIQTTLETVRIELDDGFAVMDKERLANDMPDFLAAMQPRKVIGCQNGHGTQYCRECPHDQGNEKCRDITAAVNASFIRARRRVGRR